MVAMIKSRIKLTVPARSLMTSCKLVTVVARIEVSRWTNTHVATRTLDACAAIGTWVCGAEACEDLTIPAGVAQGAVTRVIGLVGVALEKKQELSSQVRKVRKVESPAETSSSSPSLSPRKILRRIPQQLEEYADNRIQIKSCSGGVSCHSPEKRIRSCLSYITSSSSSSCFTTQDE